MSKGTRLQEYHFAMTSCLTWDSLDSSMKNLQNQVGFTSKAWKRLKPRELSQKKVFEKDVQRSKQKKRAKEELKAF